MAVDLSEYVPSLQREVNPPGTNLFATASDEDLVGYLSDAFWEASLDGFLEDYACDINGIISPVAVGGPDIPRSDISLVILYASVKMLRNKILNMNTTFRAKAGPVEFEQQNSATMLVEQLKQLAALKKHLIEMSSQGQNLDLYIDALSTRIYSPLSYWGGPELTAI